MGVTDEYLRMLVEIKGQQALTDLEKQLANIGREQANLKALYDQGAISEALLTAETKRLAAAKAGLTAAVNGLSGGMGKYQQNITATGYALNDFLSVSGNLDQRLNAIANNLPGVFAGFGTFGLALGAIVPVIALVYRNWDSLMSLIGEGAQNKIPANADALKNLEGELKKVNRQLDDYKEKQKLTDAEVMEYNRLSAEQVELERQKTEEMQRQADLKNLAGLRPEAQTARASAFKQAVGEAGGGERADAMLRQAIENVAAATGQETNLAATAAQAENLLREASQGIKGSRDAVRKLLEQGRPENQQGFARAIDRFAPETKQAKAIDEGYAKDAAEVAKGQADREKAAADDQEKANEIDQAESDRRLRVRAQANARAEKGAPREAERQARDQLERAIQQGAGVTAGLAEDVAPKVQQLLDRQVPFQQALQMVMSQVQRTLLAQEAAMEAAQGFAGAATMQLQMMEQQARMRAGMMRQNVNRLQVPFAGIR